MPKILTFMLYGHLTNHSSFVAGCLLWIRTKGTWQKGHSVSLPPLAVALVPVEVSFIGLPAHFPAMASTAGRGQGEEPRWHQQQLAVAVGSGEGYSLWLGFFEAGDERE